MEKIFRSNTYIFFLIVLCMVAWKMIVPDVSSLGYDEAFNLYYSEQDWGLIKHTSEWNMNPPLYYYFLWIWRNIFGMSEYAIRFSSIIFNALAAGVLYIFVTRNFNRLAAAISLLLFIASDELYFYSHEATPYSLLVFLTLASSYFFLEVLRDKKWSSIILLSVCNFFLIYTHYLAAVIPLLQLIVALISLDEKFFRRFGISFLLFMLFTLWRFTKKMLLLVFQDEKGFGLSTPNYENFKYSFYGFLNSRYLSYGFAALVLISLISMLYAKKFKEVGKGERIGILYVILVGTASVFIFYVISIYYMPVFLDRYFLFTAPFLYILIAWVISKASDKIKYAVVGLAFFFGCCSLSFINFHPAKAMDYKNAMLLIKRMKPAGTITLVETKDIGSLFAYYYDRNIFSDFKDLEDKLHEKEIYLVSNTGDLKYVDLHKYKKLLLVQTFENVNPGNEGLMQLIYSQYKHSASSRRYSGVTISVFSK